MAEPLRFTIDPATGAIRIGDALAIRPGQGKKDLVRRLKPLGAEARKYGMGYDFLCLDGLTFGVQPASLSLSFRHARFAEARWDVWLLRRKPGEWPTRDQSEAEIKFVRGVLAQQIGLAPDRTNMTFTWGAVWSEYDAKNMTADHAVRYTAGAVAKGCLPFSRWTTRKS